MVRALSCRNTQVEIKKKLPRRYQAVVIKLLNVRAVSVTAIDTSSFLLTYSLFRAKGQISIVLL